MCRACFAYIVRDVPYKKTPKRRSSDSLFGGHSAGKANRSAKTTSALCFLSYSSRWEDDRGSAQRASGVTGAAAPVSDRGGRRNSLSWRSPGREDGVIDGRSYGRGAESRRRYGRVRCSLGRVMFEGGGTSAERLSDAPSAPTHRAVGRTRRRVITSTSSTRRTARPGDERAVRPAVLRVPLRQGDKQRLGMPPSGRRRPPSPSSRALRLAHIHASMHAQNDAASICADGTPRTPLLAAPVVPHPSPRARRLRRVPLPREHRIVEWRRSRIHACSRPPRTSQGCVCSAVRRFCSISNV